MLLSGRARIVPGDGPSGPIGTARSKSAACCRATSLIKGGQLHALLNTLDENITLFMFGYD